MSDPRNAAKLNRAKRFLTRAASTNVERDAMEREHGLATPQGAGDDALMRTVIDAVHAGLVQESWDCVAEAADMLAKRTGYYPWR